MTEYTPEALLAMDDRTFRQVATKDLTETSRYTGPFQSIEVIGRTMSALVDWLWVTNDKISERAEDPHCPPSLYEGSRKFRKHLLAVIDNTDRRMGWLQGAKEREVRRWKQVLFEVIDAIQEGWDDDEILALHIPEFAGVEETYDLETWHEIRLVKSPDRKRAERAA